MSRTALFNERSESNSYLRRVYAWLATGVAVCALSAWASLSTGTPVDVMLDGRPVNVPPIVAVLVEHPVFGSLIFIGLVLFATLFRKAEASIAATVYLFATAFTGVFIGPAIFIAQMAAHEGRTLSGHPLRDALILTAAGFGGITTYVFVTKKDFSPWNGIFMTGLWVLIAASILGLFLQSTALDLAISSVAVLLFSGFIAIDTSMVMQKSNGDDAIGDALNLFLDVLNLFINLLRILASTKSD